MRSNRGATAIEYGLMVALIAGGLIGALSSFGSKIGNAFVINALG